jgi:hypothetical protein
MGRLRAFVSDVLDYTWPVVTTCCAVVGSDRLNRWLRDAEQPVSDQLAAELAHQRHANVVPTVPAGSEIPA